MNLRTLAVALVLVSLGCEGSASMDSTIDATTAIDMGRSVADMAVDTVAEPDDGVMVPDMTADVAVTADVSPDLGESRNISAGCASGNGLAEGEHTFMLEGLERRYILRLPNGYDGSRDWPVVLALHGNGGNPGFWDQTSGDRNIRAVLEDEAILIIAEAIDNQWRDYSADRSTWPARIESELLYFDDILSQARADLCINNDSIFAMGFSGGGSFSGVLGCRRDDIRAIAVGGSVIYFDEANCVSTPAAWITIGTGELEPPREAYRDFFRDRAGCQQASTSTDPDPCVAYEGCDSDTPVHYCEHPAGHIWPDFGAGASWQFFSQFVE